MLLLTYREWRRFPVNLCSGSWDRRDAQFSSETICFEGEIRVYYRGLHSKFITFIHLTCIPILLPFELVFFVPDVVGLVVAEELGDACRQVAVDAVHVAGCSHDGAHVFVAVLDALLHLNMDKHIPLSCDLSQQRLNLI